MSYHVIGHDFVIGIDDTPLRITDEDYTDHQYHVESWECNTYETFDDAMKNLITHFQVEKWTGCHDEGNEYCLYGYYTHIQTDDGKILAISPAVCLDADIINRWKSEIDDRIAKVEEDERFYFDDPHYTYEPKYF